MGFRTQLKEASVAFHRHVLTNARWVGVTGSTGKTTTTALISAVLRNRGPVVSGACVSIQSSLEVTTEHIYQTRRQHKYCVLEMGVGLLEKKLSRASLDIGVVTQIGNDHRSAFRNLDATAQEKSRVVRCLSKDGTAILNVDDPRVWAMRGMTGARVIGYGWSREATVRIEAISAQWPDRLKIQLRHDRASITIQTRFVGEYAALPVAAAIATGISEGLPIEEAALAIAEVLPIDGRMSPSDAADGITFVDNSWKSPIDIIPSMLAFMQDARAPRKIIVFGALSDYPGASSGRYRAVARKALEVADIVVFSGRWAFNVMSLRDAVKAGRLLAFVNTEAVTRALRDLLKPGDLVLLQGSSRIDHFDRIALDRAGRVDCWRDDCRLVTRCINCPHLVTQLV